MDVIVRTEGKERPRGTYGLAKESDNLGLDDREMTLR